MQKVGDAILSLSGQILEPPPMPDPARRRAEAELADARVKYESDPDLENTIWYGRRAAYLFRFEQAFEIYGHGIARFPGAHQLYRHRGHRYISTRQFDRAIADLERAAELAAGQPVLVEPDGIPNRLNKPVSNSHFNIWYHLGLAYYLTGAYEKAVPAYQACLDYCDNDDSLTATLDWFYMTYRRLGQTAEAERLLDRVHEGMDLIESPAYHNRLLMYKGLRTPESLLSPEEGTEGATDIALATQGYGVGNWYLYNGHGDRAKAIFAQVLQSRNWSAFGYIAAEVDMFNLA